MGVKFELRSMVDQALGCPESKGVVNFNLLHNLLHEILNHFDDKNEEKDSKKETVVLGSELAKRESVKVDEATGQKASERVGDIVEGGRKDGNQAPLSSSAAKWDGMEARLYSLESKLEGLDNLLVDKSLLVESQQTAECKNEGNSQNDLAIMWKFMSMHRRVQATEEALEKVMGILNDVICDISQLKDLRSELDKFREEHTKMQREFDIVKSGALQTNSGKGVELGKQFDSLGALVSKEDLTQFVTWAALEEALNKKDCGVGVGRELVEDGGALEQESSIDRPGTAPVSSNTVWEKVDDAPPKTAMSPSQYTKITGESPSLDVDQMKKQMSSDTSKDGVQDAASRISMENSLGEISSTSLNKKVDELSHEASRDSSRPSPQLITRLSRLGELPKQHDDVALQVSTMSELQSKLVSDVHKVEVDILPQKVDKEDLQLPDNLLEQIEMLKQGLDLLNGNQDLKMLATIKETTIGNKDNIDNMKRELGLFSQHMKRMDQPRAKSPVSVSPGYDQGVLNSVRDQLTVVQVEQEKMASKNKEDVARILDNLDQKQHLMDDLVRYTERLQETKANRENVATEMDVKADKNALEGKVNQTMFDETFDMFDRGLQEAVQKMEDYMNEELALKDTLSRISDELEGKIDCDSLQLMKDYFEKQIKDVQESRNKIARETRVETTDAAGIRRKLPIHYHCISCNRPVEVTIKDSVPALPGVESLPLRRIKFPLTSFEVEQVRHKSMKAACNVDDIASIRDLMSGRPCGGSHTVVSSHLRRSTKLHQFGQTLADPLHVPKITREVSVIDFLRGSDGNYYKGRSRQRLPSLQKRNVPPCSDAAEQNSVKGKQLSPLQTPPSTSADHKAGSYSTQRTPSPPLRDKCVDDLSSSYPQRSLNHTKVDKLSMVHHYSSDDINIPSTTSLDNVESIKVLQNRRKRTQNKDTRRHCCWDNQQNNEKVNNQDKSHDSDNEFVTLKNIKRTTPVGQEDSFTVPHESSYRRHTGRLETADDINDIQVDKDKK